MRRLLVILLSLSFISLLFVINCDKRNPSGPQTQQGNVVSSVELFLPSAFKAPAGTQTVDISAVAKDAYGGGIEGATLRFQLPSSSSGFISQRDLETDQDGIVYARYTVNLQAASIEDTITAVVEGTDIQDDAILRINLLNQVIDSLSLDVDYQVKVIGDSSSVKNTLRAVVVDTNKVGISGLLVSFSSNYGSISNVDTTDINGAVSATITIRKDEIPAGDNAISPTVYARIGGKVDSALFTVIRQSITPAFISLDATPSQLKLANGDRGNSTVNVLVQDADGKGVAGWQVDLWTDASQGTIIAASPTNASGETFTTFRSKVMADTAINARVVGTVIGAGGITIQDTAFIDFIPLENDIDSISVWSDSTELTVPPGYSGSTIVRARVVDINNVVIPDLQVSFSSNIGALSQVTLTDNDGMATALFSTNGDTGQAIIDAQAGNVIGSVSVTINQSGIYTGSPPSSIDISATPRTMTLASGDEGVSTITVVVKDVNGNGVGGFPVDFVTEYGSIAPALLTDNAGMTQTTLRSTSITQGNHSTRVTANVTVTTSMGTQQIQNSVLVYFLPLDNVIGSINVWPRQSVITALPGQSATDTIYARVVDTTNTAIPNLSVSFSTDHGALSPAALTDSSGKATVLYFTDGYVGDATIIASVGDSWSDTTQVTVTQLGSTGSLVLTNNKNVIYADGDATHALLRAVVKNSRNEPIMGDTVRFFCDLPCSKVSSPRLTDSTGTAHSIFDDVGVGCVTSVETATIIARYDKLNLADTIQIDIAPIPDVTYIDLTSSASTGMRGNGIDSAYVYARAFIASGDPAPTGTEIHFDATLGSIVPRDTIVQNGTAAALLFAPAAIGTGIVVANWNNTVFDTLEIQFRAGNPAFINLIDSLSISSLNIGESGRIYVAITDSSNWGVGRNHPVYWSTTLGTIDALSQTDSNGVAYARLNAQTEAGLAQVVVKTAGIQDSLSLGIPINPDPPNSIVITSNVDQIQVQGTGGIESAILTAIVVDVGGNNVLDGFPVRFEVRQPSPDVLFGNGLDTITVSTSSGEARVSLNSGVRSGPVRLRATTFRDTTTMTDSIWSEVTNINVVSGQPYYIDIDASYDPQNPAGAELTMAVTARVQDVYGNNVSAGTAVFFSVDTTLQNNWHGPFAHIDGSATVLDSTGVATTTLEYTSGATFKYVDVWAMCTTIGGDSITDMEIMQLPLFEGELGLTVIPGSFSFSQADYCVLQVTATLIDGTNHLINNGRIVFINDIGASFCVDSTHAANLTFWPPQNYGNQTLWRFIQYTGPEPPPLLRQPTTLTQSDGQAISYMRAQLATQNGYPGVPGIGTNAVPSNIEAHVYEYPDVSADAVTVIFYPPGDNTWGGKNGFISTETR